MKLYLIMLIVPNSIKCVLKKIIRFECTEIAGFAMIQIKWKH